ncbi:RDD family protein [Brevibacillus choshinensis]|uniref:RDD family protein n=2 Tax=Brevibacillus choshinensis TaxID=54911 RepID=A0ABX7FY05_BRECH|nr:RDD family protein [Brevibacillus choshinensis]
MYEPTQHQHERGASVVTPEHVLLRFQTAGLGSRAAALMIDTVILFLVNLTVFIVIGLVIFGKDHDFFLETENLAIAIVILLAFAFNFGYFLLLEAFWRGQTIGKRMMSLRVMRDNGQPITFIAAAIRNLFRILDGLPMGYFLGAIISFFHPQDKRLGDLVAGTIVVAESSSTGPSRKKGQQQALPIMGEGRALDLDERQKGLITREDWQLLSSFIQRQASLSPEKRKELATQLAGLLAKKLGLPEEPVVNGDPLVFLQQLHANLQKDWKLGS